MIRLENAHYHPSQVGGKAYRLSLAHQAGLTVAAGLVISADELGEVIPSSSLSAIASALPPSLEGYAVRSTAIGEDGIDHAWPGQFRTHLSVNTENLWEAIMSCRESAGTEQVLSYAQTHGLPPPRLALLIQRMVPAAKSGILFTTHPTDLHSAHLMVIEVVEGVGEEHVSGRANPHRYFVDATTLRIIQEEGPSVPNLDEHEIEQLVRTGLRLRELFNVDQDIEWALDGQGTLFINQSRPITVFADTARETVRNRAITQIEIHTGLERERLQLLGLPTTHTVYSNQNIAELVTAHPPRMSFEMFTTLFAGEKGGINQARRHLGYAIGEELAAGHFVLVGGQPRCSIVHDALTYRIEGISLPDYETFITYYLRRIEEDTRLANYPELVLYEQWPSQTLLSELFGERRETIGRAYEAFFASMRGHEQTVGKEVSTTFLPRWRNSLQQWKHRQPHATHVLTLRQDFQELVHELRDDVAYHFALVARLAFFAYAHLQSELDKINPEKAEYYLEVLTSGNTTEENPNLAFNQALADLRLGKQCIEEVTARFGHLSQHQLELSQPRYHEQRQIVEGMAQGIHPDALDHTSQLLTSQHVEEELLRTLPPKEAEELRHSIQLAKQYLRLREQVKFSLSEGYALLRAYLLALNSKWGWEPNLIFHLEPQEIYGPQTVDELRTLALKRRDEHAQAKQVTVPPILDSRKLEEIGMPSTHPDTLRGIGVTQHIREGEAVVMPELDEKGLALLGPGKILVTVTTDPAWSPFLAMIGRDGGLVTEVGGMLAHGAIYAREMGMAAVLNIPGATQAIKTGDRIRVDGFHGTVEIIT